MQIDGHMGSPLMFIYSQRKIFENLSTSYLCKKYTKLKVEEIEEFYSYTEKILKDAQKIYIDCDLGAEKIEVEGIFLAISDINKNYLETVQIYNSLVIGYNYWRNLFSTRWFKHILFIREKKSIK